MWTRGNDVDKGDDVNKGNGVDKGYGVDGDGVEEGLGEFEQRICSVLK